MIVVDSSPLIAILKNEPDAAFFWAAMAKAERIVLSASNKVEVMMVAVGHLGPNGIEAMHALLGEFEIEVMPFTEALADEAVRAFLIYGRGRGHSAKLNFGDCMSYALAKSLDAPLLFKGEDFAKTDIKPAATVSV